MQHIQHHSPRLAMPGVHTGGGRTGDVGRALEGLLDLCRDDGKMPEQALQPRLPSGTELGTTNRSQLPKRLHTATVAALIACNESQSWISSLSTHSLAAAALLILMVKRVPASLVASRVTPARTCSFKHLRYTL